MVFLKKLPFLRIVHLHDAPAMIEIRKIHTEMKLLNSDVQKGVGDALTFDLPSNQIII